MNRISILLAVVISLLLISSCKEQVTEKEELKPKAQVSLTKISQGYLPDYIQLSGKTIYLNKSSLVAPISGYITQVQVQQGDKVMKGDLLFEMQTSEAYVMKQKENNSNNYGIVKIHAPVSGRIVSLNIVSKEVFADKGAVMCVLLASNDLKLQVNLPFEYNSFAGIGSKCKVILPDNTEISATFSKLLPQIDQSSQTVKVLASLNTNKFIPENMIVTILLDKSKEHEAQILPKQCLQTDALMKEFWIMKLINDSTAIKVPVEIGNQSHEQVEILSPLFSDKDLFINEGAYGLSDTVLIENKE